MSKLNMASTFENGPGTCAAKYVEPWSPISSPPKRAKTTDRFGFRSSAAKAPAICEDGRAPAGVVVGPGEEQAHVRPVMVEVAADDQAFLPELRVRPLDVPHDVAAHGVGEGPRGHREPGLRAERERDGTLVGREGLFQLGHGAVGFLEDEIGDIIRDLRRGEPLEPIPIGIGDGLGIDIDEAEGALVPRRRHAGPVLVVTLELLPVVGRAPEAEDEPVPDVDPGIIVVAQLGRGDPPAGEHELRRPVAAVAVQERQELLLGDELDLAEGRLLGLPGLRGEIKGQFGLVDDGVRGRVGLQVAVLCGDRLEAPGAEFSGRPAGRGRISLGAGQAPGEFLRREDARVFITVRRPDGLQGGRDILAEPGLRMRPRRPGPRRRTPGTGPFSGTSRPSFFSCSVR